MSRASGLGLGLIRSTTQRATVNAHMHPAIGIAFAGAASLPDEFNLWQWEAPRMDQARSETCYAHAASACVYTALNHANTPIFVPSQVELSKIIRATARGMGTPVGQPLPPMVDQGADDVTTFLCLSQNGVCPMGPAPDGRFSDVTPENVNQEPSIQALEVAATKLIVGPYAIDPTAVGAMDLVRAAIYSGFPVWCSGYADSAEMRWAKGSPPLGAPDESDSNGGGHATFLDGWTKVNGVFVFSKCGSWGDGYGDDGRCRVSYAWLDKAWSLWPVAAQVATPIARTAA